MHCCNKKLPASRRLRTMSVIEVFAFSFTQQDFLRYAAYRIPMDRSNHTPDLQEAS
jgi:hypothetical protein